MGKILIEDIKPESLLTHLNVLSSNEGTTYEIRVSFTLKTHEIVRVSFSQYSGKALMDFCVRELTGDYKSHLIYEFAPGIMDRCLNKMFSECIKDVLGKGQVDNENLINVINKVRKNYIECTPVLNID